MPTALLFDRDDVEELDDWRSVDRIGRSSILWVDIDAPDAAEDDVYALIDRLGVTAESADRLRNGGGGDPYFRDFGSYLHVTAYAPREGRRQDLVEVECLVGERWVVTAHNHPVPVIESFRERAAGSGQTGRLDGLEFLADLLEWVLMGYLDAFEEVELELETFDSRAMQGQLEKPDASLRRLVDLRHEIGRLRRALVAHRELVLALARPELDAVTSSGSAARFSSLQARLESAVQSARDTRDSVVGSFDLLLTQTGQRTNEIMKVLTLASVLVLPGSLIAGIMGMNFELGVFENNAYFLVVLAVVVAVAAMTLVVARLRRWI